MKSVNIEAAKADLSCLIEEAIGGEEIVLVKDGHPIARLTAIEDPKRPRKLGLLTGKFKIHPNCWDPDPSIEQEFNDSPLF